MLRVDVEDLLFGRYLLQLLLLIWIQRIHQLGAEGSRTRLVLKGLFHLLDFLVNRVEILYALDAGEIFLDEVEPLVRHLPGD